MEPLGKLVVKTTLCQCFVLPTQLCAPNSRSPFVSTQGYPMIRSTAPCSSEVESRSETILEGYAAMAQPLLMTALLGGALCALAGAGKVLQLCPTPEAAVSYEAMPYSPVMARDRAVVDYAPQASSAAAAPKPRNDFSMQKFQEAQAKAMEKLTKDTPYNLRLMLYGYYNQAINGDVQGERPTYFEQKDRAKYDAWAKCKGMDYDSAVAKYCEDFLTTSFDGFDQQSGSLALWRIAILLPAPCVYGPDHGHQDEGWSLNPPLLSARRGLAVVRQLGMDAQHELTEKENLFLADAAELLAQRWAPEPPSPSRAEEDDKDLRRRQQSMSFLAWQKGQLTQQLRRRSEQTLVAAADLRELSAAVRRDALPAAKEELELSRAEEELAAARVQCLQDIQKLWDSLDAREQRLEKEAKEALAAATAARQSANALVGAEDLSRAVREQAGDLQEESSLLVDLHEDLETRDVSLQCQEAAFACLVSSASGPARDAALSSLREGIASELALALGSSRQEAPAAIKEAILSTILPSWSVESEGRVAPAPPRAGILEKL
eukprot:s266_g4.t2